MSEKLISAISEIILLTDAESGEISTCFHPCFLPKKQYWIQEGKRCQHIAFVQSGKVRMFYFDNDGNEITCFFAGQGSFITSFGSFLTGSSSRESIVAIEDTELLIIEKTVLEKLSASIPKIQIFRRIIAEHSFMVLENRLRMMQSQTAEERYETFVNQHPELLSSIPLQHTASFLGITPQHLSRLRKNRSK